MQKPHLNLILGKLRKTKTFWDMFCWWYFSRMSFFNKILHFRSYQINAHTSDREVRSTFHGISAAVHSSMSKIFSPKGSLGTAIVYLHLPLKLAKCDGKIYQSHGSYMGLWMLDPLANPENSTSQPARLRKWVHWLVPFFFRRPKLWRPKKWCELIFWFVSIRKCPDPATVGK